MASNSPMKRSDSMLTRVEEYLGYRRALGYALRFEGGMLLNFARFADREDHRGPLTSDLAARWARLPAKADRLYWARRIEVLIGFARYCKIFDPQTEIPPRHLFGPAHRRKTPYIYSRRQLEELLSAARQLAWDGDLHTYCTLFGLLACTGLRISEALGLRRDEVDLTQGILTVKESKRRRFRLVPLHSSAVPPLEVYDAKRTQRFPEASFFFVNRCGNRLPYSTVRTAFRKLTLRLGWVKDGKRPRLHDLRHSFACRVLFKWRSRKAGQEDRIDWLSHYLGHERVSDTYWYLSATPELFADAVKRFKPPIPKSAPR
jgi:integrase